MSVTSYEIGQVYFRLLSTNGFHTKTENERFTAAGWRCPHRHLEDCQNQKACRTCSTIILPHSTNQIIDLWRCRRHFFNYLLGRLRKTSEKLRFKTVSEPMHKNQEKPLEHKGLEGKKKNFSEKKKFRKWSNRDG